MLAIRRTAARIQDWARQSAEQAIPDDVLIRRFAATRDEAAFAELVRRHGSMVLGVARRLLGDHHAAEEVLQATFLLLARKAKRVHWQRSISPWLHNAAYRIARTARRRRRYTEPIDEMHAFSQVDPLQPLLWQEVQAALDEELAKLPERLRSPLVLCYLQGRTRDEAARSLGWTLATLKRRLERGRKILNIRLTRRGLALSAIGAAMLIDSPSLPAAIVERTVRPIIGDAVSTSVAALLEESTRTPLRKLAIVLVMLSAIGLGTGLLAGFTPASPQQPDKEKTEPAKPTARVDLLGDPLPDGAIARLGTTRLRPGQLIQGIAFSPDGKQMAIWAKAWGGGVDRLIFSDSATGREIKSIPLPPCDLLRMRWLADGRGLAVVKIDQGDYFVWEFTNPTASIPHEANSHLNGLGNGDLRAVDISPNGRWLATGRYLFGEGEQPIELWEVTPNSRLSKLKSRVLTWQAGHGMFVAFSPDSRLVFSLSVVQGPWRQSPAKPGGLPGPAGALIMGAMADKARLVITETDGDKQLASFDVITGEATLSADGKSIWIGDQQGTIHAFDWATGKETRSFKSESVADTANKHSRAVVALGLSKDSKLLYTAEYLGGFSIRDAGTGKLRRKLDGLVSPVKDFAISADGTRLAVSVSGIYGRIRILHPLSGAELVSSTGPSRPIAGLVLLSDGTALTNEHGPGVFRWDLNQGRELSRRQVDVAQIWVTPGTFAPDGRGEFGRTADGWAYLDFESGKKTTVPVPKSDSIEQIHGVSGFSAFYVAADGKLTQWDAKTAKVTQTYILPKQYGDRPIGVRRAALSPDGLRTVVLTYGVFGSGNAWYYSGQICIYDAKSGSMLRRWQTPETSFDQIAYSPDSRFLLVGGFPIVGRGPAGPIDDALPISTRSALLLLDGRTGEPIRVFDRSIRERPRLPDGAVGIADKIPERSPRLSALVISPDGQRFAVGDADGAIQTYELATGERCKHFHCHRNEISQMQFTADGRKLVSVSHDMTGLVWDVSFAALAKPLNAGREQLWVDLAKPEWLFAGSALAALANRSNDLVALVREHMKPAERPDFDRETIAKWVEQLDDQVFAVRERASASLSRLGREALPLLHDHLSKATTKERQERLRRAIESIRQMPVPSNHLREMRAIALLEQVDRPATRAELKRLATGNSEARLTREAQAAFTRGTKQ